MQKTNYPPLFVYLRACKIFVHIDNTILVHDGDISCLI